MNFDKFDHFNNSHNSFLWPEYFIDYLCERWIPCQASTSVLCLNYHPVTVHCSTKDAYTSEITFLALNPWHWLKYFIYGGLRLYQYYEDEFLVKLLLTRFFQITSLQIIKDKLSLCFYVFVNPYCIKAWYKEKLKSKVVFELIYSPTTVEYSRTHEIVENKSLEFYFFFF